MFCSARIVKAILGDVSLHHEQFPIQKREDSYFPLETEERENETMKWIKYELYTTTNACDAIGELLSEFGVFSYEVQDNVPLTPAEEKKMYTDIPAELPPDNGEATIIFYSDVIDGDSDAFYSTGSSLRDASLAEENASLSLLATPKAFQVQLESRIQEMQKYIPMEMPVLKHQVEDDSEWKDKWKENFKPFRIADDILIKPTWEDVPEECSPDDIVLSIDPGSAFGTGTHETTKLCLLSLRKYITPETRIMDAGCGSGILAIAALLCGAHSAYCLDIDPSAVTGTQENAVINQIEPERITAVHGNILEDSDQILQESGGSFDVVVANILADVIIPLADHIKKFLKPDGIFISSGILAEKADAVEEALQKNNFTIIEKNTMGDWVSFVAH